MRAQLATMRPDPVTAAATLAASADMVELEEAWWRDCSHWPDESPERERLLEVYHDKAAQFAVEMAKLAMTP